MGNRPKNVGYRWCSVYGGRSTCCSGPPGSRRRHQQGTSSGTRQWHYHVTRPAGRRQPVTARSTGAAPESDRVTAVRIVPAGSPSRPQRHVPRFSQLSPTTATLIPGPDGSGDVVATRVAARSAVTGDLCGGGPPRRLFVTLIDTAAGRGAPAAPAIDWRSGWACHDGAKTCRTSADASPPQPAAL